MVLSPSITTQIKDALKKHPQGLSITDLVALVDINRNTAGRYLDSLLIAGQVEMRQFGMAKIYRLSQRVPVSAVLSISSELIMQLDRSLRIIFANDPFLTFLSVSSKDLFGKNMEYSPVFSVFEEVYDGFVDRIKRGIAGAEWRGEMILAERQITFACRIAPTVFDNGQKGVSVILEDISEKKRAEETIKASEDRFRRIFEDGPLGMGIADTEYRLTHVNRRLCRMLGYTQEELLNRNLIDLTHPDHAEKDLAKIQQLFAGKIGAYRTEKRYFKKDGSVFWGAVTVSPLADKHGNVVASIALIEDISKRKEMEDKLRESEERYRNVFDWANEAIMLHPLSTKEIPGKFVEVNTAACRMLGYSRDELLALGPTDILPVELRSLTEALIAAAETQDEFLFEIRLQRKDGTTFPAESNGRLFRFGGRRVWLSLIRDITGRKRAEEALRQSEARYRSLAETSQDLIFVIGRDDTVEYVNSCAAHMVHKSPQEIAGLPRSTMFPPAIAERQKQALEWVFRTGNTSRSEGSLVLTGETWWFDHFLAPIRNADGTINAVLGISRDITNRKLLEEKLRESEQNFRLLAENSQDIIIRMDTRTVCFYVSPAVTTLLGYTPEEVKGQEVLRYVHPEDIAMIQSDISDILRGKPAHASQFRVRHKDGHYVWFETTTRTICDPTTGAVTEFYCMGRDITRRIAAEEAKKKSDDRFRDLIITTADIVWQTDADSRFVYVSPQVERILGYTPDELIGHTPFEFLEPASVEQTRSAIVMATKTHQHMLLYESRWLDRDRNIVILESHATPVYNRDGSCAGYRGIDRDITGE
ncbi:MAG: PAS domain S-box protein [Methanoregula sp.]|jgi:PAS domain S-box-containing protein